MWTTLRCNSSSPSARGLYKHLIKECKKLPENAQPYYKNFVRQGFGQHSDEIDPERIQQIIHRALQDANMELGQINNRNEADGFWKTVKIWSQKTHVVNKRLAGVAVIASWKLSSCCSSWIDIIEKNSGLKGLQEEEFHQAVGQLGWETEEPWMEKECPDLSACYVSLRKCLPKQSRRYEPVFEVEFIDFKLNCAVYIPLNNMPSEGVTDQLCPLCPYSIISTASGIDLEVYKDEGNVGWLRSTVLPKLRKWLAEMDDEQARHGSSLTTESLRLVPIEAYNDLYQKLKDKYVPNIAKIWPECTDPQKFIHEDVAIAAYLLLVWEKERIKMGLPVNHRQSFIDIGCGNGLLVYLLSCEGHPGKGIDIRARKIWSFYPPEVKLEVSTLIPSEETEFTEYDWLLGNHSDELTPWIPVMALQSSVRRASKLNLSPVRYWVLPCCPFSFFSKFQRSSGDSRYAEYLRYVQQVGRTCGYTVEEDRMRIPSTRRTCFVGSIQVDADWSSLLRAKADMIAAESRAGKATDVQALEFTPRPAVEPIRNCTRIDRSIKDRLVDLTAKCLLIAGKESSSEGSWNAGGTIELPHLVQQLAKDFADFGRLKSECGGIQTLLRNHSHIFVVREKAVRFRNAEELSVEQWTAESSKKKKGMKADGIKKAKACWFFSHHPDGCPLDANSCRYLHIGM